MRRHPIIPPRVVQVPTWILVELFVDRSGKTRKGNVGGGDFHDAESAYLRSARETVEEAARQRGCTYMTCAFGEWSTTGRGVDRIEEDTRCKYCRPESRERILKRLARWLQWRDERLAQCSKS